MKYKEAPTPPTPAFHTRAKYYVYPGAQIKVQSGYSLTMIEADVIGCEEMWKGIEVASGATLIVDKVTLNDARLAIDAKAGSSLQLTNSTLTDNYIALNLDMSIASAGVARRVNLLGLANNTLTSSGKGLKKPYSGMPELVENRGYCGMRLIGYQDFNSFGINNSSALANGLIATNSVMNVGGLYFDDMNSTAMTPHYNREGFGMYLEAKGGTTWANVNELWLPAMTFNQCKTGIYAVNMAGRVDNCTMTKVGTGIDWRNSKTRDVRLRQNHITADQYGIRSFENEPVHPIFDMADYTDAVRGNTFGAHTTGLQLGESGIGGVYIGQQHHTGNTWDLAGVPTGGYGGVHWGGLGLTPLSQFFVDGPINTSLHPPVDPSTWFTNQSGTTFGACPRYQIATQQPPAKGEDSQPTTLDAAIVGGTLPTLGFNTATQWKGKYRLYRKILRHPDWTATFSAYASFKTANDQQSTGKLAYIAEQRSQLFQLSTAEQSSLENYRLTIDGQTTDLRQKDSLLQKGQYTIGGTYTTLVQQRQTTLGQDAQFRQGLVQARLLKIQNLLQLNAAVTTTLLIDGNQKTVNAVVLNLLASDTLATGDLTTLTAIAGQCPLESGDAVYEARSIVTYYTGAGFNDSQLCAGANNRAAEPEQALPAGEIVLYPNPTSGYVNWSGTTGVVTLRVFNALGVLELEQKNADNHLDISALPDGFYTLQLLAPDQTVLANRKLLVAKR